MSASESPKPSVDLANPEIAGALAALRRARVRAEEIAAATGTMLVQSVDGQVVLVQPRHKPGNTRPST